MSDFKVRAFDPEKDYAMVSEWWKKRNWPPVPLNFLSSTGALVEDECFVYAACWLYSTNSAFSLLEHMVSNHNSPLKKRRAAMEFLIKTMTDTSRRMGFGAVISWLEAPSLIKLYEGAGFKVGDQNMKSLLQVFK